MVYAAVSGNDAAAPADAYSDKIPVGTDAGAYKVFYKAVSKEDIEVKNGVVSVNIAKAAPELKNVPADSVKIRYDGDEKELISPAITASEGCVVKYSLDGTNFDTAVPKKTERGLQYSIVIVSVLWWWLLLDLWTMWLQGRENRALRSKNV